MDIASGLFSHLGRRVQHVGMAAALAALLLAALASFSVAMIAGLPLSAPEVTIAAPLRWA